MATTAVPGSAGGLSSRSLSSPATETGMSDEPNDTTMRTETDAGKTTQTGTPAGESTGVSGFAVAGTVAPAAAARRRR